MWFANSQLLNLLSGKISMLPFLCSNRVTFIFVSTMKRKDEIRQIDRLERKISKVRLMVFRWISGLKPRNGQKLGFITFLSCGLKNISQLRTRVDLWHWKLYHNDWLLLFWRLWDKFFQSLNAWSKKQQRIELQHRKGEEEKWFPITTFRDKQRKHGQLGRKPLLSHEKETVHLWRPRLSSNICCRINLCNVYNEPVVLQVCAKHLPITLIC